MALLTPFRTLGIITNKISPFFQKLGNDHFITTVTGKNFQKYNIKSINLVSVSDHLNDEIDQIISFQSFTFVICFNKIIVFDRNKRIFSFSPSKHKIMSTTITSQQNESTLLLLDTNNTVIIIDLENISSKKIQKIQKFKNLIYFDSKNVQATAINSLNMKNKFVVGFSNGNIEIWNFRKKKEIFKTNLFKLVNLKKKEDNCLLNVKNGFYIDKIITSVQFKGISAYLCGDKVIVIDLKYGNIIANFINSDGKITFFDLSTLEDSKKLILATSSINGTLTLWDIENKTSLCVNKNLHQKEIIFCAFFKSNDETKLITAGKDNSIKIWQIDPESGSLKLIKERSGHSKPPHIARFYGDSGEYILSASKDLSLRQTFVSCDEKNLELSQGKITKKARKLFSNQKELKLPIIVSFASSKSKEREWGNILSAHKNFKSPVIWSFERKVIVNKKIGSMGSNYKEITSVCVSYCCNFGLVGTENGALFKLSMQTGELICYFQDETNPNNKIAHNSKITGICSDKLNKFVISSSIDGKIKFWNFKTEKLQRVIFLETSFLNLRIHFSSNLIAISSEDRYLRIIDGSSFKIVREFGPHFSKINDFSFQSDAKLIISCSNDGIIRIYDILTSKMIDWFCCENIVTSLDFSPCGRFLLTTDNKSNGINIWANNSYFFHYNKNPVDESKPIRLVSLNSNKTSISNTIKNEKENFKTEINKNALFSLNNFEKWKNIAFLEEIRARNAPRAPVEKDPEVPFFLTTLNNNNNNETKFDIEESKNDKKEMKSNKIFKLTDQTNPLIDLIKSTTKNNYEKVTNYISKLSPMRIDLYFRTIERKEDFIAFLDFFCARITKATELDAILSTFYLFLSLHAEKIMKMEIWDKVEIASKAIEEKEFIQDSMEKTICEIGNYINANLY